MRTGWGQLFLPDRGTDSEIYEHLPATGAVPENQRKSADPGWINQNRVLIGHTLVVHGLCISKGSVSEIWHVPIWKPTLLRNVQAFSAGVSKRETQYFFNFGMSY